MRFKIIAKDSKNWTWNIVDMEGKTLYESKKFCPTKEAAIRSANRGAKKKMIELSNK